MEANVLAGTKTHGEGLRKFEPETLTNDERRGRLLVTLFALVSWEQIFGLPFAQPGAKKSSFPGAANDRGLIDPVNQEPALAAS